MPLYDQDKMVKLVSELRKSVARLRSIGQLPCAEFFKDPDKIGGYNIILLFPSNPASTCVAMLSLEMAIGFRMTMAILFL